MTGKTVISALAAAALLPASLSAADRLAPPAEHRSELGGQGNLVAIVAVALAAIGLFVVLDDDDEPMSV